MTVTDPSGTTYQFPGNLPVSGCTGCGASMSYSLSAQTIADKNGNQISLQNSNAYVDTVGRQVVSWTGIGHNGDSLTVAGLSGSVILHWGTTSVAFPEAGNSPPGASSLNNCAMFPNYNSTQTIPFLTEIDLPNGTKYSFSADGTYGRIGKITFPGGGYVRYVWGLNRSSVVAGAVTPLSSGTIQACDIVIDAPAITDRYVSYDGVTEVLHQQFQYTTQWPSTYPGLNGYPWVSKSTAVTSTDSLTGQSTVTSYTYTSMAGDLGPNDFNVTPYSAPVYNQVPIEQSIVYQDGSGHTLNTVNKTWLNPFTMSGEQVILANGQGTTKLYCYSSNEQVTNEYEYGFQSEGTYPGNPSCVSSSGLNTGALGPLRRQTTTAYQSFTPHIVNAPSNITVADGSGNTAKQTLFSYDQTALQPSGATSEPVCQYRR
jgi:hypothetical protein